jgi:hypothetical protein
MTRTGTWARRRAGDGVTAAIALVCVIAAAGCRRAAPQQGPDPANAEEARTLQDFSQRIDDYVTMHRKIEQGLPTLPKAATPTQIDVHQREFGRQLTLARAGARHGEIMTPAMQALVRRHLAQVFSGKDAADLKGSIMDENPVGIEVSINERYPDEVPLSTMPPEILQMLPKMPEELEYRFVGRNLVIVDEHAHLIVDFVPQAIPE